jgi:hypothetical protein
MIPDDQVRREIIAYRLKLYALFARYTGGDRSTVAAEAQQHADELTCLMEEAPLSQRAAIDYLIDRYEALRASSVH